MNYTTHFRISILYAFLLSQGIYFGALELYSRTLGYDSGRNSLIISSILRQYLLYVSTLPPLPFKVSAVSAFWLSPPPKKKRTYVILESSLTKSTIYGYYIYYRKFPLGWIFFEHVILYAASILYENVRITTMRA